MKADMLDSQLAILEELQADERGVRIDNAGDAQSVQADMLAWIQAHVAV